MSAASSTCAAGVLLALLVVAGQFASFSWEVIDWDESTFMVMAQDLLRGRLPYLGLYDNKPPLIFFLFAGVMALFGPGIDAIRWFGDVCIWAAAMMIFIVLRPRAGVPVAIAVAAAFAGVHLAYAYTGTEIVANVFVAGALLLLIDHGGKPWSSWAVGLLLALAALTRSNLIFIVVAVGLIYLSAIVTPAFRQRRGAVVGYVLGGLAAPLLLVLLYAGQGGLDELWLANVVVPLSYASGQAHPWSVLNDGFAWSIRSAGTGLVAVMLVGLGAALLPPRAPTDSGLPVAAIVLLAILLSIVLGGVFYGHYGIQLYVPAALLAGLAVGTARWRRLLVGGMAALVAVFCTVLGLMAASDRIAALRDGADLRPLKSLAVEIAADRNPGDTLWARGGHLLLVYLDEPPLSPLAAHPDNLLRSEIRDPLVAAGYVPPDEFGRLLAERPRHIVIRSWERDFNGWSWPRVNLLMLLVRDYSVWRELPGLVVYRRND